MTAIDNSGLQTFCQNCDCTGFVPGVTGTLDMTTPGSEGVTFANTSTVVAPDTMKMIVYTVFDKNGEKVEGAWNGTGTDAVLFSTNAAFDFTGEITMKASIVTNGGCEAVGGLKIETPADGVYTLGSWLKSESGAEAVN